MTNQLDEETIFHVARDLSDAVKRAVYLDQVCAGDLALRKRVEALLETHENEGSFLNSNEQVGTTAAPSRQGTSETNQIGPYKIREQIGEGGMGIVYVAQQQSPVKRRVALKVIKPGMDSKEVVARFEAERQALAMMDHPGIAKVFDGGATESGQPYFAMELINGIPITQYCDEQKLGIRERLELFVSVCHAVQHAHQKGVIHRDVKPTNVLVTLQDGKPVPVVIDFGVAKATSQNLTDQTIYTRLQQIIGTTLYMSPEQAELSRYGVDTRTDIYSLGVLLYEMLSGTTPFDRERFKQAALDEVRRIIREEEPPKPSTRLSTLGDTATKVSSLRRTDPQRLRHSLRGDLDWIVMMALDKDRNRRYETANGLAMDVTRYLDDEPILARPPSTWYRFQKFYSRNRIAVTTSLLIVVSLSAGLALAIWGLSSAIAAKRNAQTEQQIAQTERNLKDQLAKSLEKQLDREQEQLYRESMRSARNIYYENNMSEVERILRTNRDHSLVQRGGDFNWYSLWKECDDAWLSERFVLDQSANRVDCHPTKNLIVASDWIGQVYLFEVEEGGSREIWREEDNNFLVGNATRPAFVDDGRFCFFPVFVQNNSANKSQAMDVLFRFVSTTDPSDNFNLQTTITVEDENERVNCCASRHGRIAFAKSDGSISIWEFDAKNRQIKPQQDLNLESRIGSLHGGFAFCPDNPDLLAAVTKNENSGRIVVSRIGSLSEGNEVLSLEFPSGIWDIEWSPDGKRLLTGHLDKNASIIDLESGKVLARLSGYHQDEIYSVAWSPDNRLIATGGRDGVVRIFDAVTYQLINTLRFHSGLIYTLDFLADQKGNSWLMAGTKTNAVWATPVRKLQPDILALNATIHQFGLSSNGQKIVALCELSDESKSTDLYRLGFFNVSGDTQPAQYLEERYRTATFSDGNLVAGLTATGQLQIIALDTAKLIGKRDLEIASNPLICFSFDETLLAVIDQSKHEARFYSVPDLELQDWVLDLKSRVGNCAINCDNNRLAVGRDYKDRNGLDAIEVFNIHSGNSIWKDNHNPKSFGWYDLKFSPTSKDVLAAGGWDGPLHVWNLVSPTDTVVINSHSGTLRSLDFSREGSVLYTSGSEGRIKAWRMPNCEPMSTFRLYEDQNISLYSTAFSNDRSILAARHRVTGRIHLIRAASPDDVKMSTWWNTEPEQ